MFQWIKNIEGGLIKVSILQEPNSELNISLNPMEHLEGEQHSQYPVEGNPNAYRSMSDYMYPPRVSAPSCIMPPTNAPYGSTYNPSWGNHPNFSWKQRPPQYAPPTPPHYALTPQPPQPPQLTSSVEQAILNLRKLMCTLIEEQKTVNVQKNQRIYTMENSLNQRLDELQNDLDQKINNLQYSISRLTNQQHVHPEEECLIDTTVEEHCKQ